MRFKKIEIHVGDKYGKLTVTEIKLKKVGKGYYYGAVCVCECGGTTHLRTNRLVNGIAKSCGCMIGSGKRLHGMSDTPEHKVYNGMLTRVNSKQYPSCKYYLEKGIIVCDRWKGKEGFKNFINDMGMRPTPNHTIERRDGDKDYCPENCYWATNGEQVWNRSNSKIVLYKGENISLGRLCFKLGLDPRFVNCRLRLGWSIEDALFKPKRPRRKSTDVCNKPLDSLLKK